MLRIYETFHLVPPDAIDKWKAHLEVEKVEITGTEIVVHAATSDDMWVMKLQQSVNEINAALAACGFIPFSTKVVTAG